MDANKRFHCDTCQSILMATPSGAVCPDGHGRIRPGITQSQLDEYRRELKRSGKTEKSEEAKSA